MKTLDEVIEAQERCATYPDCHFCYLHSGPMCEWIRDALHYLKELRDMVDIPMEYFESGGTSQELRNTSQITCPKCHSEFVILPEANNALTWEQLKQMEGKPVWYEHEFWKGWIILGKVEQGVNCEMIPDREERWYIVKDGSAKAYRKERV